MTSPMVLGDYGDLGAFLLSAKYNLYVIGGHARKACQ